MSDKTRAGLAGQFEFPGTGIKVNRMGYGAMQLAGPHVFGPPKDEAECIAVLREAVESGVDHIDTSDFYGPHVTNQIIKKALHPYPKNLVIVTKLGAKRPADGSWQPAQSPKELEAGLHDNIKNLGVEAIDIVNVRAMGGENGMGLAKGSIAEQVNAVAELKKKGLVKHIGLSNVGPEQLKEAQAITPIVCIQNMYNLAHKEQDAWVDDLAKQGIAWVPFFPLGGFSPLQSSTLDGIAKKLNVTSMQVALAWLLQRAPNVLLIPGTSSRGHLRENLAAAELKLSADVVKELNAIS